MTKQAKINTVPKGVSFMYQEPPKPKRTLCPGCESGHIVDVHKDLTRFTCSKKCGWQSWGFRHSNSKAQSFEAIRRHKPRKKFRPHVDSPELVAAIRKEAGKRMAILTSERAKFPPSLIRKGKRWLSNPKFTNAMRAHMHDFGFSVEEIREELK